MHQDLRLPCTLLYSGESRTLKPRKGTEEFPPKVYLEQASTACWPSSVRDVTVVLLKRALGFHYECDIQYEYDFRKSNQLRSQNRCSFILLINREESSGNKIVI